MSAKPLPVGIQIPNGAEIGRIIYEFGEVTISVLSGGKDVATVRAKGVWGLRVLDEGDLLEFWPTCSRPNGWIFEVSRGGWLDRV